VLEDGVLVTVGAGVDEGFATTGSLLSVLSFNTNIPPLVLLLKLEYMYQRKHRHHLLVWGL
jgi:hypothetical protein